MSQTNANIFSNDDIYTELVPPHGSPVLKPLALTGNELANAISTAKTLPKITLSSRERGDLIMLGIGGFTPLDLFSCR